MKARARLLLLAAVLAAIAIAVVPSAHAQTVTTLSGTLPDGATWKADVPAEWTSYIAKNRTHFG